MFRDTRHIHLVAIGGIGMSGIAEVLLNLGFKVSGSDLHRTETTDRLVSLGARVDIGHAPQHVDDWNPWKVRDALFCSQSRNRIFKRCHVSGVRDLQKA